MPSAQSKAREPTRDELHDSLERMTYERDLLREQLTLLEKAAHERQIRDSKNLEWTQNHRDSLLTGFQRVKAENETLTRAAGVAARNNEQLRAKLHEEEGRHPARCDKVKEGMWNDNWRLQSTVYNLSDKNDDLQKLLANLETKNKQLEKRASRLAGERDDLTRKVDDLSHELQEASRGYYVEVAELQRGGWPFDDLVNENNKLRDLLKVEEKAHKKTKAEVNELKNVRIKKLEERINEVQQIRDYLQDELEDSQKDRRYLIHEIKRMEIGRILHF
ncbi:hypothetical protein PpBr36_06955 [Pyricularia pennisetigena]|uniref:hypothetical protein n=1 Tax=Pyricularia pennisetigena TaxID=1578925 RepID=UPI001154F6DF|nr:hypothetical protein PpBr36_06955 [Pyricularia pennisetigena]TLS25599.1 hypothetical protein PpBr36_06955 [Pyricularia pennisetigena]